MNLFYHMLHPVQSLLRSGAAWGRRTCCSLINKTANDGQGTAHTLLCLVRGVPRARECLEHFCPDHACPSLHRTPRLHTHAQMYHSLYRHCRGKGPVTFIQLCCKVWKRTSLFFSCTKKALHAHMSTYPACCSLHTALDSPPACTHPLSSLEQQSRVPLATQ